MKKYFYIIVISLACFSCNRKEVSFISLKQFDRTDTTFSNNEVHINSRLHYIIDDYNESDQALKAMDSCAKAVAGTKPKDFTNFTIVFYKSSDMTNVLHLKSNPRDIDRYSQENDMMYSYKWVDGKFIGRLYLHD